MSFEEKYNSKFKSKTQISLDQIEKNYEKILEKNKEINNFYNNDKLISESVFYQTTFGNNNPYYEFLQNIFFNNSILQDKISNKIYELSSGNTKRKFSEFIKKIDKYSFEDDKRLNNLIYYIKSESIQSFLIQTRIIRNIFKTDNGRINIIYKKPEVLLEVNFLLSDYKGYKNKFDILKIDENTESELDKGKKQFYNISTICDDILIIRKHIFYLLG